MNKLTTADRALIVGCLVEGMSLRAASRMARVSINTVTKLLLDMGCVCRHFHDDMVKGVQTKRVQCDEIWSFCYAKDRSLPDEMRGKPGVGSVWTWTAIDADTKLMIEYRCGDRGARTATLFMRDVAARLANRVQLTTDGYKPYFYAVLDAFGQHDIDYAILHKIYGRDTIGAEMRYSPPQCIGCVRRGILGRPDGKHVSTSFVERQNLTMRMSMRRFTRLTNGFSRKFANLQHAVALHFMHYNFCRKHQTLGTSPAVAAGLAKHVWSIEELVGLLEGKELQAVSMGMMKRGKYRPRRPISN